MPENLRAKCSHKPVETGGKDKTGFPLLQVDGFLETYNKIQDTDKVQFGKINAGF